eukprot:TRINITY_DN2388_c0_g1_i1.p1 TRINITY_DN2388_c0_g1~~TRINITY_DN2388_c0_g1_i1.p1  ORF type:complete len:712 (+),score=215.02 TRINITY_DN2388_c0_g1_i1:200-2335(+)
MNAFTKTLKNISPPKQRSSSPPRGTRVQVTVIEAKGLSPKDKAVPDAVVGTPLHDVANIINTDDPFCKVTIGKVIQKTSTKSGLHPRWNETFLFENVDTNDDLKLVIRDNILSGMYKGHFFGEAAVSLKNLKKNTEYEEWIQLKKRSSGRDVTGSLLCKYSVYDVGRHSSGSFNLGDRTIVPLDDDAQKGVERNSSQELSEHNSPDITASHRKSPTLFLSDNHLPLTSSISSSTGSNGSSSLSRSTGSRLSASLSTSVIESDPITEKLTRYSNTEKSKAFAKKFTLPQEEILIKDFSCALLRNILMHGRLYISQNYVCFYSNLFRIKILEVIPMKDVADISKSSKGLSSGIQITTTNDHKYHFASFFSRDKTFDVLTKTLERSRRSNSGGDETEEEAEVDSSDEDQGEDAFLTNEEETETGFLNSESSEFKKSEIVNEELPISMMKFFRVFFLTSNFAKFYHEQRKDYEISVSEWTQTEGIGTTREVVYRAPLRHPIGPKSARCQETQRYVLTKTKLVIETYQLQYDIPYGDSFRIEGKWEITPVAANSCRLVVSAGVYFMKKTWFKGKIESASISELKQSFAQFVTLARQEIAKQAKTKTKKSVTDSGNVPVSVVEDSASPPSNSSDAAAGSASSTRFLLAKHQPFVIVVAFGLLLALLSSVLNSDNLLHFARLVAFVLVLVAAFYFYKTVRKLEQRVTELEQRLLKKSE